MKHILIAACAALTLSAGTAYAEPGPTPPDTRANLNAAQNRACVQATRLLREIGRLKRAQDVLISQLAEQDPLSPELVMLRDKQLSLLSSGLSIRALKADQRCPTDN